MDESTITAQRFLRPTLLGRYLVRSLAGLDADTARLEAARLGYALGQVFSATRRGNLGSDWDDYLRSLGKFEIKQGPYGPEVRTDGSDRDNAAALKALDILQRRQVTPPAPPLAPPAPPPPLLSERIDLFLEQFRQRKISEGNKLDTAFSLRVLLGLLGDKPLVDVRAPDMDILMDALAHWPPNASKKPKLKDLTPTEVVATAKRENWPPIGFRTREKHLDRIRVFFNWALEREDITRNPAASLHFLTRDQEETRNHRAFTGEELAVVFDPERRAKHCTTPAQWWCPLVALYTGARVAEIALLRTNDIEAIDGVYGFVLHQRVKNRQSKRFVPIHPELLRAGLFDYRNEVSFRLGNDAPLFPSLNPDPPDALGDWFNRTYLRRVCDLTDPKLVFYCFRHTFSTLAERAGVIDARIAEVTGHSLNGSILRKHYIDPGTVKIKHATVCAVAPDLPPVPRYEKKQFNAYLCAYAPALKRKQALTKRRAAKVTQLKPTA